MLLAGIILINVKLSMFDLSPAFISKTCSSVLSSVIAWVLFVKSEKSKSKVLIRLAHTKMLEVYDCNTVGSKTKTLKNILTMEAEVYNIEFYNSKLIDYSCHLGSPLGKNLI